MMEFTHIAPFLFVIQIVLIFFISRVSTNEMFYTLRIFFKNEKFILSLVSIFYLPGTIIHEFAHFIAASMLFLKVKSLTIFPRFLDNYIKLGSVVYEKKDVIRGILVGIAPIFAGLFCFFIIDASKIFPSNNLLLNIFIVYFIFTVSSTMFSSKQDLVDLIFVIPLIIIVVGVIYIFNIKLDDLFKNKQILLGLENFTQITDKFLFFSLLINGLLLVTFKSLRFVLKRK